MVAIGGSNNACMCSKIEYNGHISIQRRSQPTVIHTHNHWQCAGTRTQWCVLLFDDGAGVGRLLYVCFSTLSDPHSP